jgi:hypothetical protein
MTLRNRAFIGHRVAGSRALLLAAVVIGVAATASAAPPSPSNTIGLVLGDWRFALYETEQKKECPEGFQYRQMDNYKAEYPTAEAQKERERQVGYYTNRGPHGENVFYFPTSVNDPLPFRAVQSTISYGLNLDGETQGQGAGSSIPHDNFVSPDGEQGIDNQLYRVLGCQPGVRKQGIAEGSIPQRVRSEYQARLMLEITGVDDETNDADVTVTLYRGLDPVEQTPSGELVPNLSQRIDVEGGRRFIYRTHGRIDNGVLTSEPIDVRLPQSEITGSSGERRLIQMRVRLNLTAAGAEGLLAGYADIEHWYLTYAKQWGAHVLADMVGWSGPATYQALYRFADYRDPQSGKLTGISTAYQVKFVRTFIIHTEASEAVVNTALAKVQKVSQR